MTFRLMLASAAALVLGAAALLAAPEPPAERVVTRAELLAAQGPRAHAVASPSACGPVAMPAARVPAEI